MLKPISFYVKPTFIMTDPLPTLEFILGQKLASSNGAVTAIPAFTQNLINDIVAQCIAAKGWEAVTDVAELVPDGHDEVSLMVACQGVPLTLCVRITWLGYVAGSGFEVSVSVVGSLKQNPPEFKEYAYLEIPGHIAWNPLEVATRLNTLMQKELAH